MPPSLPQHQSALQSTIGQLFNSIKGAASSSAAHEQKPEVQSNESPTSVTFFPASHKAEEFRIPPRPPSQHVPKDSPAWIFFRQVYKGKKTPHELLQSSVPRGRDSDFLQNAVPKPNGFVHTVLEAYNNHRALIIRPDDVWLAILVQFNFFVNGNAELLRKYFVSHEGKEELIVVGGGNRYSADFAAMSRKMTELMEKKIVDPELRSWALPTFSTTSVTDTTIYAMVMMASLKEYFSYTFALRCGIPQVTLEGTKEDWEALLSRLEKLKEYGKETDSWYRLLRPIISRFVAAYDNPNSSKNRDFWNKVAHIEGRGSGPRYLAGWITAFCYFNSMDGSQTEATGRGVVLDGVTYPKINTNDIPGGYAEVDVLLDDNGVKYDSTIVAGSVGMQVCVDANLVRNTVRPLPAWWYLNNGLTKDS